MMVRRSSRPCCALRCPGDPSRHPDHLDQAVGDGDLGITLGKIADALSDYADTTPTSDLGKFLGGAGMLANKVGSSTMGTLLATALMRAGKVGQSRLAPADLAAMLQAADQGMQERGKAQLGDKTIVDALHPAAEAFAARRRRRAGRGGRQDGTRRGRGRARRGHPPPQQDRAGQLGRRAHRGPGRSGLRRAGGDFGRAGGVNSSLSDRAIGQTLPTRTSWTQTCTTKA